LDWGGYFFAFRLTTIAVTALMQKARSLRDGGLLAAQVSQSLL
jgi:hypothetical protein